MFRQYHYLNGSLGAGVRCYCCNLPKTNLSHSSLLHCVQMKAKYYRVSRLVVLPDYQGIGVGKRLLNFIAQLYSAQTRDRFYLITSNPQLIHGKISNWRVMRIGHASQGRENTRMNKELKDSLSRKRITVSLQYIRMRTE